MSVCFYCGNRSRQDYSTKIAELKGELMCASCSKRRGASSHKLFSAVVLHDAEQAAAELSARMDRLRYAAGITETAKPAPTAEVEKLSALMDNWEDDAEEPLSGDDPRLDMDSPEFDAELYARWLEP